MDAIEEIEYKDHTIQIYPDESDQESPRDWDNLGHMACFHRRYNLGDDYKDRPDYCKDAEDFLEWMREHEGEIAIILPLYLYDHSVITIWTEDGVHRYHQHYAWDGGQVGFIYVLKSELRKEYKAARISQKTLEKARQRLISEVQVYDQYLTDDIYGYEVFDQSGNEVDSCWGFYGQKSVMEAAKEAVDQAIKLGEYQI